MLALSSLTISCSGLYTSSEIPAGPPIYRQGYADGCHSGKHYANHTVYVYPRKSKRLFQSDSLYRQGWEEGIQYCYEEEMRAASAFIRGGR